MPGHVGILCLHDGRATTPAPDIRATLQAVETAIPLLLSQGFQLQTLTEMLRADSTAPPKNG